MKKIANMAISAVLLFVIGLLVMVGMRAGEWLVPAPESRIVLCFANELDRVEICQPLVKILKQAAKQ